MLKSNRFGVSEFVKVRNDAFNQDVRDTLMQVVRLVESQTTKVYQEDLAWDFPKEKRTPDLYSYVIQTGTQCIFSQFTTQKEKEGYLIDVIITATMFLTDLRASNDQDPTAEEEQEKTPNPWFNTTIRDQMG